MAKRWHTLAGSFMVGTLLGGGLLLNTTVVWNSPLLRNHPAPFENSLNSASRSEFLPKAYCQAVVRWSDARDAVWEEEVRNDGSTGAARRLKQLQAGVGAAERHLYRMELVSTDSERQAALAQGVAEAEGEKLRLTAALGAYSRKDYKGFVSLGEAVARATERVYVLKNSLSSLTACHSFARKPVGVAVSMPQGWTVSCMHSIPLAATNAASFFGEGPVEVRGATYQRRHLVAINHVLAVKPEDYVNVYNHEAGHAYVYAHWSPKQAYRWARYKGRWYFYERDYEKSANEAFARVYASCQEGAQDPDCAKIREIEADPYGW